jgi:hypothetical protein
MTTSTETEQLDPFALGGCTDPDDLDNAAMAAMEFEPWDNAELMADLTQSR